MADKPKDDPKADKAKKDDAVTEDKAAVTPTPAPADVPVDDAADDDVEEETPSVAEGPGGDVTISHIPDWKGP